MKNPPNNRPNLKTDFRGKTSNDKLEIRIDKLERELTTTTKMAVSATRENKRLMQELQRLITRINNNESDIGQLRSKR